jgi:hypothetical protein
MPLTANRRTPILPVAGPQNPLVMREQTCAAATGPGSVTTAILIEHAEINAGPEAPLYNRKAMRTLGLMRLLLSALRDVKPTCQPRNPPRLTHHIAVNSACRAVNQARCTPFPWPRLIRQPSRRGHSRCPRISLFPGCERLRGRARDTRCGRSGATRVAPCHTPAFGSVSGSACQRCQRSRRIGHEACLSVCTGADRIAARGSPSRGVAGMSRGGRRARSLRTAILSRGSCERRVARVAEPSRNRLGSAARPMSSPWGPRHERYASRLGAGC